MGLRTNFKLQHLIKDVAVCDGYKLQFPVLCNSQSVCVVNYLPSYVLTHTEV